MKIYSFSDFLLEFKKTDIDLIKKLDDYFTISIEYELVANFDIMDEPPIEDIERTLKFVKNQVLLDLSRGKLGYRFIDEYKLTKKKLEENEERMFRENPTAKTFNKNKLLKLHQKYITWTWVNYFIDFLLKKVDVDDEDITDKRLNRAWETDTDDYIASLVINSVDMFVYKQNLGFLIDNLKKYLPNFYKNYSDTFKYEIESDVDKQRILEFSSKSYIKGLNSCFKQINDFYDEFEKQDFWIMNERTALHVNIGVKDQDIKWNPIKGLLLMSDMNRNKKTPFVFTNIMWRLTNRFTQSLLDAIKRNLTGEIEQDYKTKDKTVRHNLEFRHKDRLATHKNYILQNLDKLDIHDIKKTENFLNKFLIMASKDFYIKEFGVKLLELENKPGYVEFRYVGGDVNRKLFLEKILYFCYIVYLMTNEDYKKEQYHKRLYKYIEYLKELLKKP